MLIWHNTLTNHAMTKVLVPYDFSEEAQNALDFTTALASRLDNVQIEVL